VKCDRNVPLGARPPAFRSYCKSFKNAVAYTRSFEAPFKDRELHTNLGALDLQLHVVLARRFPILPLLPTVAVSAVAHFLPAVEQHAAALRPATKHKIREKAVLCADRKFLSFFLINLTKNILLYNI
jgi:hypothetical protein